MQTYNLEKMQELLQDFYNLTNMKICIYDNAENELCFYPEKLTPFCSALRKDKVMQSRCIECDKRAFAECKKTYKPYHYVCHAGLIECVSPIVYDKKIIGYMVLGQRKDPKNDLFEDIAHRLPIALHDVLKTHFHNLPYADVGKIHSATRILDACTGYEYLKGLLQSNERKIDNLIAGYVNEHLTDDLSVQTLCSKFHLSHREIYTIFKEYFQATPAEYVKLRRLYKACDLLKNTAMPVHKIAWQCGIPDYNYFSKIFKRTFNITPRTYRKQT